MRTLTLLPLVSPRYIQYAIGALLLKVVVVLMLVNCFPGAVPSSSMVTQTYWISGSLLEESARYAQEFNEQQTQQTKGEFLLFVLDRFLSLLQQSFSRPWLTAALAPLFVISFLRWRDLPVHALADDGPLLA